MTRYTVNLEFDETDKYNAETRQFIAKWLSKLLADAHLSEIMINVTIGTEGIDGIILHQYTKEVT